MNALRSSGVPVAAFAIAILLAVGFPAGRTLLGAVRPQAKPTDKCLCDISLTDLDANARAEGWKPEAPGDGVLRVRGTYKTNVNVVDRYLNESLSIKMHVKIHDAIQNIDCEADVFGTARNFSPVLEGSDSCRKQRKDNEHLGEKRKDGLSMDDGADLDAAIRNAGDQVTFVTDCGTVGRVLNKPQVLKLLSAKVEARVGVSLHGQLEDGQSCQPKKVEKNATLDIDKDGDSKRENLK